MNTRRYIVLVLLSALPSILCTIGAQVDREFWFAIPYLVNAHDQSQADGQGQLCITTLDETANVTITQPALTNTADARYLAPRNLQIPANSSLDIPVSKGWLNRAAQSGTSDYGLHIESDADITLYYAQVNQNSEIYTYKGRNALGTSFVVPMQRQHSNAHSASSSIEIIATEPNTQVTITTPVLTQTNQTATTWTVTLQQGQVYTVYAASASVQNHLGGTVITATKPVAVNTTDDSVASTGQDLMGEQLVPEELAGAAYIALKNNSTDERLYLYTFPNQPITYTLNGGVAQTLAGGSNTMIQLTEAVNYLEADAPFVCYQMTGDGGELGGTVLPRLDCTGSQQVAIRKRFPNQKVGLLVKTAYTADFSVNGAPYSFTFQPVPSAPEWSYAVTSGAGLFGTDGIAIIRNTSSIFHCSILDYGGGTCSYGYFSGYNQVSMTPQSEKEVYIVGEDMHLSLGTDSILFDEVIWTYPDGSTHNGNTQLIPAESTAQGGWYSVTGISREGCLLSEDTYRLLVHVVQPIARDTTVCISEEYPTSTLVLYDSLHMGQNLLFDTIVAPQAVNNTQLTKVWEERVSVKQGQTYHFSMNYSTAATSRNMTVNVLADNQPIAQTTQRITASGKTLTATYQASQNGRVTLRVEAGQAATPTTVQLTDLTFLPAVVVQDTLRITAISCEQPQPNPCPTLQRDTTVLLNYCDTLPAYEWHGMQLSSTGFYSDTVLTQVAYDEGICDSLIHVLYLEVIHCEPEIIIPPHPCPDVVRDTTYLLDYCDTLPAYEWHEMQLSSTGFYSDTVLTQDEYDEGICDSLIHVLYLEVIHCEADTIIPEPQDTCIELIMQRWHDVLFVINAEHNGGYEFVSYTWYCNGQMIDSHGSYLYSTPSLVAGDAYQVEVLTTTGDTIRSCTYIVQDYPAAASQPRVRKVMEHGQLFIYIDDKRYTAMGQISQQP